MAVASYAEMIIDLHTFPPCDIPPLSFKIEVMEKYGTPDEKQWANEQREILRKEKESQLLH